jgi:tetratricopeptide (TPR) repeat protein
MAYRRITRQEMKHDEFVDFMTRATMIIEERWKEVAIGIGLVFVVIVMILFGFTWLSRSREAAKDELALAESVLNAPVLSQGANPSDPLNPTFPTESARAEAALERLEGLAGRRGQIGALASYYRGVALIRLARSEEAEAALQDAMDKSTDPLLTGLIRHALASAASARGDLATAEQRLREMTEAEDAVYPKDVILHELASILELEGRSEEADKLFEQIVEDYPDSPLGLPARASLPAPQS